MPTDNDPTTPPIEVPASNLPTIAVTLLRYALTALGGLLISKKILPVGADLNNFVSIGLMVISTGYGLYLSWRNNKQKQVMANKLPDKVATVV